jgi:NADH:ubiquinone reductase (H+-translocating)
LGTEATKTRKSSKNALSFQSSVSGATATKHTRRPSNDRQAVVFGILEGPLQKQKFHRLLQRSLFNTTSSPSSLMKKPTVVVIGGGFAGVYATRHLLKYGYPVFLMSRRNHFTFTPLLHEVATGSLITHDVAFEYESFFKHPAFEFISGEVSELDPDRKKVQVNGSYVTYDVLVIATGSRTNEHLVKGMEHAYELKVVEDARRLKNAIIEKAQGAEKDLTVTVVGGGPTGLELVFEIDRLCKTLKKYHPSFKHTLRVIHAQAELGGKTLSSIHEYINSHVKKREISVELNTFAKEITSAGVQTSKGFFASDITVLCAGVRPSTDFLRGTIPLDERCHITVDQYLRVVGFEDMYAAGDVISIDGESIPKLAQTAVVEGDVVARNIHASVVGKPLSSYRPRVNGMLLSLGYGRGVGQLFGIVVKGVLAWYLWRTIYLFKTPGLRNKLRVAFSWTLGLFSGRNLTSL